MTAAPRNAGDLPNERPDRSADASVRAMRASDRLRVVEELNEEHAVILLGDRPAVLREGVDQDGLPDIRLLSVNGFHEWMRPQVALLGEDGDRKRVPKSKVWINDERRRQYLGLTFLPCAEPSLGYYNLWKGFAVEPDPAEGARSRCQRLLDHIADNVCRGDEALFAWVMGWFAQMVQEPMRKLGTSLVLRGPQGAGKSIVGEEIGALLGPHFQIVNDSRFITGRFNAHLVNCLLLQLEEATWGGDHAAAGKLKDIVTGEHHLIEYKGKEPVRVRNYVRLLITSNNEWVVPAGLEERRFAVLDIGEDKLQDGPYFEAIRRDLRERGGRAALLHYLLTYDYRDIPLRQIPSTGGLYEQKLASLDPERTWWLDVLTAGKLPAPSGDAGVVPTDALYQHYTAHAKERGVTRRMGDVSLGHFLRKALGDALRDELRHKRTLYVGGSPTRPWCYVLPALADCRRAFAQAIRTEIAWPDPHATWEGTG